MNSDYVMYNNKNKHTNNEPLLLAISSGVNTGSLDLANPWSMLLILTILFITDG